MPCRDRVPRQTSYHNPVVEEWTDMWRACKTRKSAPLPKWRIHKRCYLSWSLNKEPIFLQAEKRIPGRRCCVPVRALIFFSTSLDSSGPRTMPEHYRHWIKVTEGRREFRAWTDRLPFRREAMIRGVNGQVLIAKRFFPVVWRGGLNWLVQGSIRMPRKRMVDISEGQGRPGYAVS